MDLTLSSAHRTDTTLGDPSVVARLYRPHTPWRKPAFTHLQLPSRYSFDIAEAQRELQKLKERFEFKRLEVGSGPNGAKKKFSYRGLGLTTRANSEDPLYDSLKVYTDAEQAIDVNTVLHSTSERNTGERKVVGISERGFTEKTEACVPFFASILSKFQSPLLKVRILELKPGGVLTSHIDFPYYKGIRLHAFIETNDECWWEIAGERFQIPADGNFYWMDVGSYHSVVNYGNTPRFTFSVNLSPYFNHDGTPRFEPGKEPSIESLVKEGLL